MFSARRLLALLACTFALLLLFAPLLMTSSNSTLLSLGLLLRTFWSFFCHQDPQKTMTFGNIPFIACYRCTALFWGAFCGSLMALTGGPEERVILRIVCLVGVVPLALDVLMQSCGFYANNGVRCLTGLFCGSLVTYASLRFIPERGIRNG